MKARTEIIAEIAQGYEGDPKQCERFIRLAKKCGADGVKFQIFEVNELCIEGYKHYDLFKSLYIEPQVWKQLIALCHELKIGFYADIFGLKTLDWIGKCNIAGIKIHASDLKNYDLLEALKDKGIRIIVGNGGSTLEETRKAVQLLGNNDIVVMNGFQAEPNYPGDIELSKIPLLKRELNCEIGYTDHIDVTNPLTISVSAMAVVMGATYIEKHLTFERDHLLLEDYISALNPNEFISMVKMIRDVESFPDPFSQSYTLTERELAYRKYSKKVVLANHDIEPGKILQREDVVMLRTPEPYTELLDLEDILGRKAAQPILKHKIIRKEHLQ